MSSQAPGPEKPSQAQQGTSLETPLRAARAPVEAYNEKNWHKLRSAVRISSTKRSLPSAGSKASMP